MSSTSFSCTECDYFTSRKHNLKRHMKKRHNDTPAAQILPLKIARHEPVPNIINPPANDHLLEQLEHEEIKSMLEQNTQVGFGITQMTSTDENISQVYIQNFHRIRDSETHNRRSRIFLRYLCHDRAPLIETIAQALENIFQCQTNAFKINLSFSFILQHRETGEFRYHYASNNNQLLNSPKLIRNQQDLDNLLDFLALQDFPSHLKDQRPNTKWAIECIVSLRIHLVMTTYPLGNPPKLPDYIKNNRFIIGLEKDENSRTYKDHLCFFHWSGYWKVQIHSP